MTLRRSLSCLAWAALAAVLAGCATKKDVRTLQQTVLELQARQDSLLGQIQAQNRILLDTLRATGETLVRVRGDLAHQILQLEQQLIQIQELTGQSQRRLAELRQQMESRGQELGQPAARPDTAATPASGTAEQLYGIGVQQLQRGAAQTARRAFEQVVREHPLHERAPDAQFNVAETYVLEKQYDTALREFERVVELFPNSARAPTALYRAGLISEEQGNIAKAREYFQRVVSSYARSDEARLARERLTRRR